MPVYEELLPERASGKAGIRWVPTGAVSGILSIDDKNGSAAYVLHEVPARGYGREFRLDCAGGQSDSTVLNYTVCCGADGRDSCNCRGFAFGKGKPCRHLLAVRAIADNGWLPGDLVNAEADAA